jgi:predicted dinucleotide-binding enzyme
MKVGILGSGEVGQALGDGFVSHGHDVKLGAREATNEKVTKWAAKHGAKGIPGTFREAAAFGEIVAVATLWNGTESALPGARVVKVFNIVGNKHMVDPKFPGGPPTMFLCGNDSSAKAAATDVCKAFGWETVDLGGIEGARLLEPMCILWVHYGAVTGSWNHAFKMLRT